MATRWLLHVDLDQFIAAVEMLRRPELAERPIVVGGDGDPTKRGVVSTANYAARALGIRSGMPLRTAYKRCPEAVFLPVDAGTYLAASREVMDTLRTFPAVVQVAGWDEAFLAIETDAPETLARAVQRAVLDRTGLWCSIGIGDNTLRAKIASGFAKPQGVFRLTGANWTAVMGERPTVELFGVGKKTAAKLAELGIRSVRELAGADEEVLAGRFGPKTGPWLRALANGEGSTEVSDEPYVARGHGRERTFQRDLTDPDEIRRRTAELARELASELRDEGRPAVRLVVKVRFAPFTTSTRSLAMPEPTLDPAVIERGALEALERFELDRPVRLLGVRAELAEPEPGHRPRPWI